MAIQNYAEPITATQVVHHRVRRAAAIVGYSCPDCGADHPLNGRMICRTCFMIHDEAAGHSSDMRAEMSDKRGHVVDPEVARRRPALARELREYVGVQARAAYEWAAVEMITRRHHFLAGRRAEVVA